MQQRLGRDFQQFRRVYVRTPREVQAGPHIEGGGREVHGNGGVEHSDREDYELIFNSDNRKDFVRRILAERREPYLSNLKADVIGLLAGPFAEARYSHSSLAGRLLSTGNIDFKNLSLIIETGIIEENEQEAILVECTGRARWIVRNPGNWKAIMVLADELLQRRTIEAPAVMDIINPELQ
jgi:hypothetical protein